MQRQSTPFISSVVSIKYIILGCIMYIRMHGLMSRSNNSCIIYKLLCVCLRWLNFPSSKHFVVCVCMCVSKCDACHRMVCHSTVKPHTYIQVVNADDDYHTRNNTFGITIIGVVIMIECLFCTDILYILRIYMVVHYLLCSVWWYSVNVPKRCVFSSAHTHI